MTFEPGAGGTLAGAAADGRVQIANILPGSKLAHGDIPAVKENAGWRFTGTWTDGSGKEYTADDILALEIDRDYTFTAQYESTVVPAPSLAVTKSANVESAAVGDEVVYTITVKNTGTTALTGVKVTDTFSGGHGALRFELPDGVTDNGDGTFTIGELAAGESVEIKAKYTVLEEDAGTTLRNTAVADSAETGPKETTETVDVPESEEPDEPWWPPIIPPDDDDDDDDDEPVHPGSTVPPMLNGKDHFAYVIGYEDGTVKPEGTITRAEVATIVFRLLKPEVRDGDLTTANSFADVDESDWYNMAVSTLVKLGIITGRTENVFDPDAPITRAEFAALFARFDESAALGWITGYEDGSFRPDAEITRAEAMTMINRVLERDPVNDADLLPGMRVWSDNPPAAWYYFAVQEATNSHEYTRPDAHEDWTKLTEDPDWTRYQ